MYYPREEQILYKKRLASAKHYKSTPTQLRYSIDKTPIERHVFCQKYHSRPIKN